MLDVHPPHHPTHTWRDFFIHIATIVVGLLIAIGLEQTVEAIHHAHQRRELREALRQDTEFSNTWVHDDIAKLDRLRLWAMEQLAAVEGAGPSGSLKVRRLPSEEILVPNTGVWLAAKQNGEITLLRVGEQNWLTDMNREENAIFVEPTGPYLQLFAGLGELDGKLLRRTTALPSGHLDLSRLTPAERLQFDDCLRRFIETAASFESSLVELSTYTEYLLTTPPEALEQSTALARYFSISNRNQKAHPDLIPSLLSQ